ncbi:uncharacterized protein ATNIH1004_005777 [Aspergillus tanneri]|uniref:DUF8035 domain-containing protein n=1 Tax=Aspergillus tanneri TaxID=1220188 RepID=A0A5M9MNT0_9EURO|nr:uncharacterized protein ATNIH1004_005777 [Aspergillus tanneri]KAA8647094.1 hypothetical protein ATNIH1004_005777 [Aspergillus tanneri]
MPPLSRAREYDEDLYDYDRDPYPRRSRRGRRQEESMRYNIRAPSPPLPIEEFERLDVRDRSAPEFLREDFDSHRDRRPLPARREHNGIGAPPRELAREFEKARGEARRYRGHPHPKEVFREDDYISQEEPEPEPERFHMENDTDGVLPIQRKEQSLPRRHYGIQEEYIPRSRSQKEDRRMRRPRLEKEIPPRRVEVRGDPRDQHHHHRASQSHPAFGYETEIYDSTDEDVEVMRRGRRRVDPPGRDRPEEDNLFIQDWGMPYSSEVEDPRFPPPVRMSLNHQDFDSEHRRIREEYPMPRAPRPPSPEVSFEKPKRRHRKESGGKSPQEERIIETRGREDSPIPVHDLSPEPLSMQKDDIAIPLSRPRSLEREKDVFMHGDEHEDGNTVEKRENMAEDWAIVNASTNARDATRDDNPGIKLPQKLDWRSKFTMSDERLSDGDADYDRGKIGRRYVGVKDRRERLWTEITKDLVVKEAIERMGFECEETVSSYYIFSYLQYDDVSALVELSEDIRRARRRRIHEMELQRGSMHPAPVAVPDKQAPLLLDRPLSPPLRSREGRKSRERELAEGRGRPRFGR